MPKCVNCGTEFIGNFCPTCGTAAGPAFCPNCGTKLDSGVKFCPNCGNPVSAAASAPVQAQAPTFLAQTEELQAELYSLYKVLEPVRELDLAGRAIADKISELSGHQPETDAKFHTAFVHYMPFIDVVLPEDLITPTEKREKKGWENFIKAQNERLYGVKRFHKPTDPPSYRYFLYELFKKNETAVMNNLGASFLYYKMQYCFDNPPASRFWKRFTSLDDKVINTRVFDDFLKEKLGNKRDDYIIDICTKLKGGNKGDKHLCDVLAEYNFVEVDKQYDYFFSEKHGFPKTDYVSYAGIGHIRNQDELDAAGRAVVQKAIRTKKELDGSVAGLRTIKKQIDAKISEYMGNTVNEYIEQNVKIVPVSYAKNWESVAYFLYLIMNKRGRDIYEVINQYEIDMKHQELTSALMDIRTEINSQTNILSSKLDEVKKAVVQMANSISYEISKQTKTLKSGLDNINYSVISTGASVVGAISQLGASMGQAMSNMQVKVI